MKLAGRLLALTVDSTQIVFQFGVRVKALPTLMFVAVSAASGASGAGRP